MLYSLPNLMQLGRSSHPATAAFTLMETTVAAALSAMFLSSLVTLNVGTMDTIRCAKESIAASQILQQRMASMRIANWHDVTEPSWFHDNLLNTNVAGSTPLKNLSETLIITAYGSSNV